MVSKALSNNEISEGEFEKIFSQISKWIETYRSFDEVNLQFDKIFPRPGSKSETLVYNK